ncbi:MAG: carboxypeptidase-like regulatory domain-containing protein [Acidobacteriota bacterium]
MNELKPITRSALLFITLGLMMAHPSLALGGALGEPGLAGVGLAEPDERATDTATLEEAEKAVVAGKVTGRSAPVADATVYAYEVASYSLKKVLTDGYGRFLLGSLPVGMYKIVAYKDGFAPTIELLLRKREQDRQYLEIEMREEQAEDVQQNEDYWSVRSRVPADVLRDIHHSWTVAEGGIDAGARIAGLRNFEGQMLAHGGVEQLGGALGEAQLTGAVFDLKGAVGPMQVGINGQYTMLIPTSPGELGRTPDAQVASVAVALESPHNSKLSLASSTGRLTNIRDDDMAAVNMEHYRLQWSGKTGARGTSDVTAQYTEEANYHNTGLFDPIVIPESSRTWNLKGTYSGALSDRTSLQAGVSYQQRIGQGLLSTTTFGSGQFGDDALDNETIGIYGLAGSEIIPRVVVEYGLYSSVRDGSLSLMPHGGLVVDLGANWQARTSVARRVEDRAEDDPYYGFSTAFYSDRTTCHQAGEACYEVVFTRGEEGKENSISLGAVHREFAETLRLYFSPDFFDRLESLFVVQGDELPELQFSMVRRIAPKVLAKLESNIATGGGGIFYATDERPYENQVRYLVTSLDTRFQQTSTGVFIAFHHLEQELKPVSNKPSTAATDREMQRLQLMLTQDLNVLADFASNWAVRFNVELSRGSTPYTLATDDELRKKLTGGISVSF